MLELGYLIGRLGRGRVCALKRGELEIPSDYAGVVWKKMDSAASQCGLRLGRPRRPTMPTNMAASRITFATGEAAAIMALAIPVSWVTSAGNRRPAFIRLRKAVNYLSIAHQGKGDLGCPVPVVG